MDTPVYVALTRQRGLTREMDVIANNIANASTTGFRREGVVFSEHVKRIGQQGELLSMATAHGRTIDAQAGAITATGGTYDFAIEGEGFFLVETPDGQALTRAGHFTPNAEGELVTPEGHRLLDEGGGPVFVPPEARSVTLSPDGTLAADGTPLTRIGLWQPTDPSRSQLAGARLQIPEGGAEPVPEDGARLIQGHLEGSNVNPISEIARMIAVQRAYEMGQSFLELEDGRIRVVVQTLGR